MRALAPSWARAYRRLRAGTLLAQLALLVVAEILLFDSYRDHVADFHWAAHFLVGLTAAALWNLGCLLIKGAPARGRLLSVLVAHLFAMAPDLLFNAASHTSSGRTCFSATSGSTTFRGTTPPGS